MIVQQDTTHPAAITPQLYSHLENEGKKFPKVPMNKLRGRNADGR